jgi:hypothetical protein
VSLISVKIFIVVTDLEVTPFTATSESDNGGVVTGSGSSRKSHSGLVIVRKKSKTWVSSSATCISSNTGILVTMFEVFVKLYLGALTKGFFLSFFWSPVYMSTEDRMAPAQG